MPRRKLHREVSERIVEAISNGTVAPGDRLPSGRGLIQLFGIGRPAIRKAKRRNRPAPAGVRQPFTRADRPGLQIRGLKVAAAG
jgi:DNA-binding transcriptional MocR family regulator